MLLVKPFSYQYAAGSATRAVPIPGFSAGAHELIGLSGASGCGKTTALNLIAGLLPVSRGCVWVDGQDIGALTAIARDRWRGLAVGVVPQDPQLIDSLSALQNVVLPLQLAGHRPLEVDRLFHDLGLAKYQHHTPAQLSRGQQQRVAIARAFANQPSLILADEPTANLDDAHTHAVLTLLHTLCQSRQCTAVIASHDARIARYCDQTVVFE